RRFPTKEALVQAIFDDILVEYEELAAGACEHPDPGAAFAGFLDAAARMQASNQGFYDVVTQRLGTSALNHEQRRRFIDAAARRPGGRAGPSPTRRRSAAAYAWFVSLTAAACPRPSPQPSPSCPSRACASRRRSPPGRSRSASRSPPARWPATCACPASAPAR